MVLLYACRTEPPPPVPREEPAPAALSGFPPTARVETWTEMREDARAKRSPGDGGGRVRRISGPDTVEVGREVRLVAELEVGPEGIALGGAIVWIASPFWGWSAPQDRDPLAPGLLVLEAPDGVRLETALAAGMLLATVQDRALRPGEVVRFEYTGRADRFAERAPALWVGVDADGDGVRGTVSDPVSVHVVAGPPASIVATLPSAAEPGKAVALRLAVVDGLGNAFRPVEGEIDLLGPGGLTLPASVRLEPDDDGIAVVEVTPREPGIYVVDAHGPDGIEGVSNPMVVREGVVPIRWADLQIHTALSDGSGAPEDVYRYAREVAGLDAAAITDHDHWGMRFLDATPAWRERIEAVTEAAHAPGEFVTVFGYEWTSWLHGHRHVLAFDGPVPIASSVDDASDTIDELRASVRGRRALIVPHHPAGGPVAVDWTSLVPDPELEPLVEVASVHGQSDSPDLPGAIYDAVPGAFVQDQLARGLRFGLIGSTDGHDGHPGLSQLAAGPGHGGLAAIEGADLTREGLYAALRARRTYATNGPRIVLRVSAGGAPMGSALPARPVELDVRVIGTAPIDRVELVCRAGVVGSRGGEGGIVHATFPLEPVAGDFAYVRVVQADGGLAWSSPFFFD